MKKKQKQQQQPLMFGGIPTKVQVERMRHGVGQLDSVKLCEIIIYKKIILLKISEIFFFFFIKKDN